MRIDQPDGDGGRADDAADRPDANEARDAYAATDSGDAGRKRTVAAASASEHETYRARVDAVFRAHAIDQAYDRVGEIERNTVTPAMKRIEAEDQERRLAGLERIRNPKTPPDEVSALKEYQRDVCAGIAIPPEATEIPDYNHLQGT